MPGHLGSMVASTSDPAECTTIIYNEVWEILTELSRPLGIFKENDETQHDRKTLDQRNHLSKILLTKPPTSCNARIWRPFNKRASCEAAPSMEVFAEHYRGTVERIADQLLQEVSAGVWPAQIR